MSLRRLVARAGVAALLLAIARPATGQAPEPVLTVAVEVDGCPSVAAVAVRRALEVEAGGRVHAWLALSLGLGFRR